MLFVASLIGCSGEFDVRFGWWRWFGFGCVGRVVSESVIFYSNCKSCLLKLPRPAVIGEVPSPTVGKGRLCLPWFGASVSVVTVCALH